MPGNLVIISFFLALGVGWRALAPQGIGADALRRPLMALTHGVVLPLTLFFIFFRLPLDAAAWRTLLYVVATTLLALAVAWLWLWKSKLPGKTKGAYLIAAGFGSVFFLGIPLDRFFVTDWSMRVAAQYGVIANVFLLFTAGAILGRALAEPGKAKWSKIAREVGMGYRAWLREPLLWAALAGLVLNLVGLKVPSWLLGVEAAMIGAMVPLLLLLTALTLNWSPAWKKQWLPALPIAGIQLVLLPLLMWGMISLFGSPGLKTARALLLDAMLPATLLGFAACERYKFDSGAYGLAFFLTTALSLITVPLWYAVLL